MRKAFSSLITMIVTLLFISAIVSFFMRDSFETLSFKTTPPGNKVSRRVSETQFLVSTDISSRYNFSWIGQMGERLKRESANLSQPIHVPFYIQNQLNHAEVSLASLGLIDDNCDVRENKLKHVRDYLRSFSIKGLDQQKQELRVVNFRALPENESLHYSQATDRVQKCLSAQIRVSTELSFSQENATLIFPSLHLIKPLTAEFERDNAIYNFSRSLNIALGDAHRKNPAGALRIVVSNHIPYSFAQAASISDTASQFAILSADEVKKLRNAILQQNGIFVRLPDLEKRVLIGLDTSTLWQIWQTPKVKYYKDAVGESVVYEDFIESIRKVVVETDGQNSRRLLKVILAGYSRDSDERKKYGESMNLPYQRASSERLMRLQIDFFLSLYEISNVGLEPGAYVSLEMPAREKFPLLHKIIKPLAKKFNLYDKLDGSDAGEVEDSLGILRRALVASGK